MKYIKYIYILLIGAIILFWAIYFIKRTDKTLNHTSNTKILVPNKIVNNGNSKHNDPVTANFEITNVGTEPLIITAVKTDCNCTASDWERKPILPQKKTIIKLIYNGTTLGYFQKKAMVSCNIDNSPILLVLRGNITN